MKPTVVRTPEGISIGVHAEMEDPELVFYADRIVAIETMLGFRILALHENVFTGEADAAVEVIMETSDFHRFIESLAAVEPQLRAAVPDNFELPSLKGAPPIVATFKAFWCYLAVGSTGLSLDFQGFSALDMHRVTSDVEPPPQLRPLLRVETLPGRVHHLLRLSEAGAIEEQRE